MECLSIEAYWGHNGAWYDNSRMRKLLCSRPPFRSSCKRSLALRVPGLVWTNHIIKICTADVSSSACRPCMCKSFLYLLFADLRHGGRPANIQLGNIRLPLYFYNWLPMDPSLRVPEVRVPTRCVQLRHTFRDCKNGI